MGAFLTPKDAAKKLGIDKKELVELVKAGKIQTEKITKDTWRFKPEVVEAYARKIGK